MTHKVLEHLVEVAIGADGRMVALKDSRPSLIEVDGAPASPLEGLWIIHLRDPSGAVVARRRITLTAQATSAEFSAAELFPGLTIGAGYVLSIRFPDGKTHMWPADAGPWRVAVEPSPPGEWSDSFPGMQLVLQGQASAQESDLRTLLLGPRARDLSDPAIPPPDDPASR